MLVRSFYVLGTPIMQSSYCKTNGCRLIKRTQVSGNTVETYSTKTLGKLYEIESIMINGVSGLIFSGLKTSSPNESFLRKAKIFVSNAVGVEMSRKISASKCKTFDQLIKTYNETGVNVPNQGLIEKIDGYNYTLSCIISPLTDKILASDRYKYPQVTITISTI